MSEKRGFYIIGCRDCNNKAKLEMMDVNGLIAKVRCPSCGRSATGRSEKDPSFAIHRALREWNRINRVTTKG